MNLGDGEAASLYPELPIFTKDEVHSTHDSGITCPGCMKSFAVTFFGNQFFFYSFGFVCFFWGGGCLDGKISYNDCFFFHEEMQYHTYL